MLKNESNKMKPELLNLLEIEQSETVLESDNSGDTSENSFYEHFITSDTDLLTKLFLSHSNCIFLFNCKI